MSDMVVKIVGLAVTSLPFYQSTPSQATIIEILIEQIGLILISLIMGWLAWLVRRYLRSLGDEKKLATITQVANAAIDYAEDLDKRGDLGVILTRLNLSPDVIDSTSKGIQKLHVAGHWVKDEVKRMGVDMTEEEAQKWVAAEFQKRIAGLELTPEQLNKLQTLLLVLQDLDMDKVSALLMDESQTMAKGEIQIVKIDSSSPEVKSVPEPSVTIPELSPSEPVAEPEPTPKNELTDLARQAVEYVETLKIDRQLSVPEIDIATAWMLTEVTKRGLTVAPDQISREIYLAFGELEDSEE